MKVLILSSRARPILKYSCSLTVIFKSQIKERYDSPSPDLESRAISSQIQALSGSLVAKSSRSSNRCLLHWRLFAALSIGSSAVCTLRTVLHSSGGAVDRAGYFSCCNRCGHRQISTVIRFQAHPCGFLHWGRGPYSRAAGGSFLTGAVLKARSARGVSGSFGRSVLKPQLLAGCCPSVPSLAPSPTPSDS